MALPVFYRLLSPSRLVGVDVDHLLLMEAKRRVERSGIAVQLLQADVRSLPFPAASFDLVVDFGTCFHISNAAAAVQEIARVLVDGGIFASETKVSQILAHPIRTRGRHLRVEAAPQFTRRRNAVLWSSFVRAMRTEERQHGV